MTRRFFAVLLATALILAAGALRAPAADDDEYSGFATSSVLHVDAITTDDLRVANVEVGVASAAVNSGGLSAVTSELRRPVVPDGAAASKAHAAGSVVEAGLVLSPPQAPNQLAPFRAVSTAPGGTDASESLLNQSISPVVHVDLAHRAAATRWNEGTCVLGAPIAAGQQHLARVEVLETADDPATPASSGFDSPVAALDANAAGPPRASSYVRAVEQLYKGAAEFGLQSVVATTLAPVTLLQGTPNEFTVEVDGPAFLSATADGTPGGAAVDFAAPLVTVIQAGVATEVLPGEPIEIRVPATGDAIAEVRVGVVSALPAPKGVDGLTRADGTRAAAQADVVLVKLLDSPGSRGATVALGHMEAAASVPAGGISCPLPVTKSANPRLVSVGRTFDTTITVRNPFACPLTGVALSDAITVEQDARFAVTGSRPSAASSSSGGGLSAGSARWSLGTIPPGGSSSAVVTLRAEGGSGRILDTATARATLASCPAKPARSAADVAGLAKADVPARGQALLSVRTLTSTVLSRELVPTGIEDLAAVAGGLLMLAGALLALTILRRQRFD